MSDSTAVGQVGVALNPYGVTRGTILSCIVFIFLTWAVTPDVFYGTTYYFYLSPENAYAVCYVVLSVAHFVHVTVGYIFCPSAFAGACLSQMRPMMSYATAKVQTAHHPTSLARSC